MSDEAPPGHAGYRAHLTGSHAPAPPIHRYLPSPHLTGLIRNFWIPVWDLPGNEVRTQRVLQYPVCVVVIATDYARCYGPTSGLSTVDLAGRGWAAGVMLQPAAGRVLLGQPVDTVTDRNVPVEELPAIDGAALRDRVRAAMASDPADPSTHKTAITAFEDVFAALLPVDEDGRMVNQLVEMVETDPAIVRVDQLAAAAGLGQRALQRLTRDRLGLSPKWLIQRRRLHDAVAQIKAGDVSLADLAHALGYADQAHFTRDFTRVTGLTPGVYLAEQQ